MGGVLKHGWNIFWDGEGADVQEEWTLTINILLQNDRKRAKPRLFKCRWGVVYDCVVPWTHRTNAEMPLENILLNVEITQILGDGAKDGDKALEILVDGWASRLTCCDN